MRGFDRCVERQQVGLLGDALAIPASASASDQAKAIDLVKQLRIYSLAQASSPPKQNYVDMAGKLLDGVVKFDDFFYQRLARMVNEAPVLMRDLVMMGQLRSLGIEKFQSRDDEAASVFALQILPLGSVSVNVS